ncbi:MAG: nicotinate-nucleotide--dimethylbenzimidazole phosphoribosyltransferase [Nitrospiraceae bacterium]
MTTLEDTIARIAKPDPDGVARAAARARLDCLTKPLGSLGRLEDLAAELVAMSGGIDANRWTVPRGAIVTFAADHGVAREGVSAYPSEVTAQMVLNFLRGGAGVNVLARHTGVDVRVVDIGVAHDFGKIPALLHRKVKSGSGNLRREPALPRAEAEQALTVGIDLAKAAVADGIGLLGTGEMGIGNTTPSAAIAAVMTGRSVAAVTGLGTGIDDAARAHKVTVIEEALALHRPDPHDALGVLAAVGGLDIAGMAGLILGAAEAKVPVMLDGFISGAAALIAVGIQPRCRYYLLASHRSVEPGHRAILEHMGLRPLLELDLRLGEGTGACLGIGLAQAAMKILLEMATFETAGVSTRA